MTLVVGICSNKDLASAKVLNLVQDVRSWFLLVTRMGPSTYAPSSPEAGPVRGLLVLRYDWPCRAQFGPVVGRLQIVDC